MIKGSKQDAQIFDEARFTKVDIIKTRESSAFMLNFLPGQDLKPHTHPDRELYLLVVNGEIEISIDEEVATYKAGDVLLCEDNEKIGLINHSDDPVSVYATMTKVK